jgi:hypothetical protein
MATNNFLVFDSNNKNTLSDSAYSTDSERLNGVSSGIARSALFNKALHQATAFMATYAQLMADAGYSMSDSDTSTLKTNINNYLQNYTKPATSISVSSTLSNLLGGA